MEDNSDSQSHGLRLLALDGGGIRGLSELIILQEIMHRIKHAENLDSAPRPCEYFDLIGGTSTGGLIAIMLGRLGMSVEEAIGAYARFAKGVFSKKKWRTQDGTFKATALEKSIKEIVKSTLGDPEERMRSPHQVGTSCKAFVCAVSALHIGKPTLFRSYDVRENQSYNCKIWEAARATSAAPTFFKRIYIGDEGLKEEFIDAGLGCNNPVAQVFREAKLGFGEERRLACIVSIGTGHARTIGLQKPDAFQRMLPLGLIDVLQGIATDCEKVAEEFEEQFKAEPDVFFRFNVQQGLQEVSLAEWEKLAEVATHTKQYVAQTVVGRNINKVTEILRKSPRLLVMNEDLVNDGSDLR